MNKAMYKNVLCLLDINCCKICPFVDKNQFNIHVVHDISILS